MAAACERGGCARAVARRFARATHPRQLAHALLDEVLVGHLLLGTPPAACGLGRLRGLGDSLDGQPCAARRPGADRCSSSTRAGGPSAWYRRSSPTGPAGQAAAHGKVWCDLGCHRASGGPMYAGTARGSPAEWARPLSWGGKERRAPGRPLGRPLPLLPRCCSRCQACGANTMQADALARARCRACQLPALPRFLWQPRCSYPAPRSTARVKAAGCSHRPMQPPKRRRRRRKHQAPQRQPCPTSTNQTLLAAQTAAPPAQPQPPQQAHASRDPKQHGDPPRRRRRRASCCRARRPQRAQRLGGRGEEVAAGSFCMQGNGSC